MTETSGECGQHSASPGAPQQSSGAQLLHDMCSSQATTTGPRLRLKRWHTSCIPRFEGLRCRRRARSGCYAWPYVTNAPRLLKNSSNFDIAPYPRNTAAPNDGYISKRRLPMARARTSSTGASSKATLAWGRPRHDRAGGGEKRGRLPTTGHRHEEASGTSVCDRKQDEPMEGRLGTARSRLHARQPILN
ncbi:hypothetical protein SRHO_G00333570 [Serrasalmus rhombeus]